MAAGIILRYPFGIGEAEYDAVNAELGWIPKTGEGDRPDGQQSLGRDPDFGAGDGPVGAHLSVGGMYVHVFPH